MVDLLFVRDGELFHLHGERETRYTSAFAEENEAASRRDQERHTWKAAQAGDENPQALVNRTMLWGSGTRQAPVRKITIGHAVHTGERWYYTLNMTRATGLFYYDTVKGEETRLFHRADFVSSPFCILPDRRIVVTTPLRDGSSCLTLLNERGIEVRALTEGGAQDQNPFFHDGAIYFNSYGLGRDDDGHIRARSHSTINRIPLGEGDVECVLEDENYDFILPRCAPDGTLYAIRMPRVPLQSYSAVDAAKDVLLFPVRLGMALFGFLNAFTTVFGKQSLTTAGGPPTKREQDNKQMIHDRLVDVAQESKKAGERVAAPADWQLIRWRNGACEVVAKRVSTYDLIGEAVVYSSGYDVTVLGAGKKLTSPNRLQFLSAAAP